MSKSQASLLMQEALHGFLGITIKAAFHINEKLNIGSGNNK